MPATTRKRARDAHQSDVPAKKPRASKSVESTSSNIQGGLNGDYRITGTETTSEFESFLVPDGKGKDIPCQSRGDSSTTLIFTHGAGGGLENPATETFARGYAQKSGVTCFQGTMNLKSRFKAFECVLEHVGGVEAVGGRSMGARAAVMLANARNIKKLVLVSYPLEGPKGELRDEILVELAEDVSVLFVIGSQDSMCDLKKLEKARDRMRATSQILVVDGADHGMGLGSGTGVSGRDKKDVVEQLRLLSGKMAAKWVKDNTALGSEEHIGPGQVR